jgi:hypothetical protein
MPADAFPCRLHRRDVSRRNFLWELGGGLGGVALSTLLAEEAQAAARAANPLAAKPPMFAPKAKAVINIFCPGGISHLDTFDHKPELVKRAGTPFDTTGNVQFFASKPGNCQPSYWPFRQHGESGLGSQSDDLPAFVVLPDPRGLPPGGPVNWGAGFLPAIHQGTVIETAAGRPPIADLFAADDHAGLVAGDDAGREFLAVMNARHLERRADNSDLAARIAAYELAARLQLSAPQVTDLAGEPESVARLYQLDHPEIGPFGRQCLLARRLVERGVRFVQIYCGAENTGAKKIRPNWDSHEDLVRDHGYWGPILDGGASGLLSDLKAHGLLDSTLVMCQTEFGRQPAAQGKGRDHNAGAFTVWMAGGGIKGGTSYGTSDELGFKAAEHPTYCYDLHATALHLLGIDHTKLSVYNNGIQRRLTDVHGHVLESILA